MTKLLKKDLALLTAIVEATQSEAGFAYQKQTAVKKLVDAGLVEVNETISNDAGEFATRATAEGIEQMTGKNESETGTAKTETSAKPSFELETGIALPTIRRGGRGATLYPFDDMEPGHSFHVPASEDKPNPAKSLASTVSSATARFKDEEGNVTRKFVVRAVGEDDPKGAGARIFRVE